jgi:hypothetical protein
MEKGDVVGVHKAIQEVAKEKVITLLTDYDVAYIDYDAMEDEYSISLDKEKLEANAGAFVDGRKISEGISVDNEPVERVVFLLINHSIIYQREINA